MLMFVWGLKLEKILKTDGASDTHSVSSSSQRGSCYTGYLGGNKTEGEPYEATLALFTCHEKKEKKRKAPATSLAVLSSAALPLLPQRKKAIHRHHNRNKSPRS